MKTITNLRVRANMTQAELAEKLKVTQAAVSYWESGKKQPGFEMVKKIAILFSCTIDALLDGKTA